MFPRHTIKPSSGVLTPVAGSPFKAGTALTGVAQQSMLRAVRPGVHRSVQQYLRFITSTRLAAR